MTYTINRSLSFFCSWLRWFVKGSYPVRKQTKKKDVEKTTLENMGIALIALTSLVIFLALFLLRTFDDNKLTSWKWVFSATPPYSILGILAIGYVLAYGLTRCSVIEKLTVPFLVLSSFTLTMILWTEPEVIIDTSRYFIQAKYLEIYGISNFFKDWGNNLGAWTDLPLIPFLYGLLFKIFGENRLVIQIFNSLLFSGTVVFTYLIGMTLWNRSTGLYAGLSLLGMPYLLTQVPLMLVDVATMFFLTVSFFMILKALRQGGGFLMAASITVAFAMMSKYSMWLMITIVPIIAVTHLFEGYHHIVKRTVVIAAGVLLLVGILFIFKYDVITKQINLLLNYQWPGLSRWRESHISSFFFQIHPFISLAAVASIYLAFKNRNIQFASVSWLVLLVISLGIQRSRYIIPVLPMLALMAAYGLNTIGSLKIKQYLISSIVIYGSVIALFVYLPFFQSTSATNIKQAGRYLDSLESNIVEVITLPSLHSIVNPIVTVPLLDLFTKKTLIYHNRTDPPKKPAGLEKSSLRFTWELTHPDFYSQKIKAKTITVIYSSPKQTVSPFIAKRLLDYTLIKEFVLYDKVFKFQTIIQIYRLRKNIFSV